MSMIKCYAVSTNTGIERKFLNRLDQDIPSAEKYTAREGHVQIVSLCSWRSFPRKLTGSVWKYMHLRRLGGKQNLCSNFLNKEIRYVCTCVSFVLDWCERACEVSTAIGRLYSICWHSIFSPFYYRLCLS